jgi:CheY-like chemotaxis protein
MSDCVHVLIAEDQGLIASLIEITLIDEALTPTVVTSGAEALAALDAETSFRVLVTDIRMEPGPDGWTVAAHARERQPGIHVIYITGDSMDAWRARGVPGSMLIAKPFAPEQIVVAVMGLLDGSATGTL